MKILYYCVLSFFVFASLNAQTRKAKDSLKVSDTTFKKVEIESDFPGGQAGWLRYLKNSLVYPAKAERRNIQGTVTVQFIVGKDGSISDIEAIDGPELLRDAAVKVIKDSPNWKPAVQFGRKVKSYKKQPITFRLQ